MTLLSSKLGLKGVLLLLLLLLGNTLVKGMPLVWFEDWVRYPAPVQMSGEELGINTHRVFCWFKCWVIIDLTPTLMLEKVGSGEVELTEEEDKVWELHPLLLRYLICFQHRFSNLSLGKILLCLQLHLCPTTVLMFQWLFGKVVF